MKFKVGDWVTIRKRNLEEKRFCRCGTRWNSKMDRYDGTTIQIQRFRLGDIYHDDWFFCPNCWVEPVKQYLSVPYGITTLTQSMIDDLARPFFVPDEPQTNSTIKSMLNKFTQLFMSEPEKTFMKAGLLHADGLLNSEGQALFINFLLKKFGDEFKTEVVDKILEEND